jgi:excisionase family DNA binding protein
MNNDPLIAPKEVCELFAISRTSLEKLVKTGKLSPVKINSRVYRYKASQVNALASQLANV